MHTSDAIGFSSMAKTNVIKPAPPDAPEIKLTGKQKVFCDEYLKDFNATRAAIAAGYSKETARSIASENLTKPDIKAFIQKRLAELSMSAEEATKLMSDIAKGSLNNYFSIKKVEYTPKIKMSLKGVISRLEGEISFEEEVAAQLNYNKKEKKIHDLQIASKRRHIIRYNIELKKNPSAYRIVDGPTELVDSAELDMVKLVNDKERGRIKSIAHTATGMKVELFPADGALVNVLRMHGKFEKDNEQLKPTGVTPFSDSQVDKLLQSLRKKDKSK